MKKTRTATQLLEKLDEVFDKYEKGEATMEQVKVTAQYSDSVCRVYKTAIDVSRMSLRDNISKLNFLDEIPELNGNKGGKNDF